LIARLVLVALLLWCSLAAAFAAPSRIIILRHGEKEDAWRLCGVGEQRAQALAANYLGRNAANSLFASGDKPAAFLAITLHTLELAAPAAATWSLPLTLCAAPPADDKKKFVKTANQRTQEAVADLMSNAAWRDKTVVMVWEHKHIANAKLEGSFPGEKVTLRQLLGLDTMKGVPDSWPDGNYDYFWIVDFGQGSSTPTGFRMAKQMFDAPYAGVPSNDWGAPDGLTPDSQCNLKGAE
jgi:hypothetical protein